MKPTNINERHYNMGLKLLKSFHTEFNKITQRKLAFNEFLDLYGSKKHFMIEGLGSTVELTGMAMDEAMQAMKILGRKSKGRVPSNWLSFNSALTKAASDPNFWEGVKFAAVETLSETSKAFAETGKGVISTLKLGRYLPLFLGVAGLAVIFYYTTKLDIKRYSKRKRA